MTSAATSGEQRAQRKQDLLLASRALRREAVTAFDQLAGRADAVARRVADICPTGAFALKGVGTCGFDEGPPPVRDDGRPVVIIPMTRVP